MAKYNENNPTINWSEEEKYDFCKTENKWTKDLKVNHPKSTVGRAGDGTLDPTFSSISELTLFAENEVVDHKKQFKERCHICDYGSQRLSNLKNHLETHQMTRGNGDRFACNQCDKHFKTAYFLKSHVQRMHEDKNIKLNCKQCDKIFNNKKLLNLHVQRMHTEKTISCNECDSRFGTNYLLTMHKKNVHVLRSFKCDLCKLRFKKVSNVNKHMKEVHEERSFHCLQCNARFATSNNLKAHTESVHEKIKNWQCTTCPFSAYLKSNFIEHMRIHTGEKPFGCKICLKRFTQSSHLKVHSKTHN